MIKLLNAHLVRLKKNKSFWIMLIFTISYALINVGTSYRNMVKFHDLVDIDQLCLSYSLILGIACAFFTNIYLGIEYSDGTLRNKIIIGHSRLKVYLSNLVISFLTSTTSYILYIVIIFAIGLPIFGGPKMPNLEFFISLGCILLLILAFSSIFTFISMLISQRAIAIFYSIICIILLAFIAIRQFNTLNEPEYRTVAAISNIEDGSYEFVEEKNPRYPTANTRKIYEQALAINPFGQAFLISGHNVKNYALLPLYSSGVTIIFTVAGIYLFSKKVLK